ncbi:MAG: transposase [Emcibacter sp.]|nr:transposase [Emcibacter sp.]
MAHKKSSNPNRWSKSFKKRLLSEVAKPGSSFERIARLYGLKVNQLLAWQKRYGGTPVATSPAFFPIEVLSDAENGSENLVSEGFEERSTTAPYFEIDLPCGTQLRCGPGLNPALLTEALSVLRASA